MISKVHLIQLGFVGQVLEKDEEIAELQKRLTVLIRLVETYQETLPVSFSWRPSACANNSSLLRFCLHAHAGIHVSLC